MRQRLWANDSFVYYDLALKKAINRIREVLGDSADSPRFIETVPRQGYRFIGDIGRDAPRFRSLAVLPFANFGGNPDQDYLADAITRKT